MIAGSASDAVSNPAPPSMTRANVGYLRPISASCASEMPLISNSAISPSAASIATVAFGRFGTSSRKLIDMELLRSPPVGHSRGGNRAGADRREEGQLEVLGGEF